MWKIPTGLTAIGLSVCMVTAAGAARPGGGGRPGPAPAPHAAPAPHFSAPRAAPHFAAPRAAPHFAAPRGAPHFAPRVSHFAPRGNHFAPRQNHFAPRVTHAPHANRFSRSSGHPTFRGRPTPRTTRRTTPAFGHGLATPNHFTPRPHRALAGNPRAFAARRRFASGAGFRPFLHRGWHPHHHLGWVGPVFWPYAYGDFFYYALWPDDYADVDPFWTYGYGDIYEGIFSPDAYDRYVQGPGAPARMKALTEQMAQSCSDEAAEVTGWPIDQIQAAVQPNEQQNALLDDFGNAIVKAGDVIKSNCPTSVSFTPTSRLGEMQTRLQGMVQAVDIVTPPLTKFYDSLSDEQKARFNDVTPAKAQHAASHPASNAPNQQAQCGADVMAWPTDQIDRVVQPNDAQRAKLGALQSATANAADIIKAACPSEIPSTPPGRLEAVGKRLKAMLQAVRTVEPALKDFYDALNDDQKARFNGMGKQLIAANHA